MQDEAVTTATAQAEGGSSWCGSTGDPILSLLTPCQAFADGSLGHAEPQEGRPVERVLFIDSVAPRATWLWTQHSIIINNIIIINICHWNYRGVNKIASA